MKSPTHLLAEQLSRQHDGALVLPTGNATTALWLIFRAMGLKDRAIAIPNSVCINVPISIILSGNRPVFVDVEEDNLGLSPSRLEEVREPLAAVVAVHAYGMPCRIDRLGDFCRRRSIPLIEDFALAQGALFWGRPVGLIGDVSCVSFGAGKILSCGGGGAILTKDPSLFGELQDRDQTLPPSSDSLNEGVDHLLREYRRLYNDWVDRDLNGFWKEFRARVDSEGSCFISRFPDDLAPAVSQALLRLDEIVAFRAGRAERLRGLLPVTGNVITPLIPPQGSVYWRQNLLIREGRNRLLKALLAKKFRASSWYGPADLFFGPRAERTASYEVSDRIGATMLNLWVNDEVGDDYAPAVAREISGLTGERTQGA
jgi:dTDP-4-amino-4,6-dideoxygalactose transaminase